MRLAVTLRDLTQPGFRQRALDGTIRQPAHVAADDQRVQRPRADHPANIGEHAADESLRGALIWGMATLSSPSAVWMVFGRVPLREPAASLAGALVPGPTKEGGHLVL